MGSSYCITVEPVACRRVRARVCTFFCTFTVCLGVCIRVCVCMCCSQALTPRRHGDPALSPSPEPIRGEPELAGSHVGSPPCPPSCHCGPLPCFTLFGVLIPHPLDSCLGCCCELLGPGPYPEPPHLGQGGVSAASATVQVVVPEGLQGALGRAGTALSSMQAAAR